MESLSTLCFKSLRKLSDTMKWKALQGYCRILKTKVQKGEYNFLPLVYKNKVSRHPYLCGIK